jgi:sirohydrochlorin cobaltochelatase
MSENYTDATLIVLGHGSTQNQDSAKPVFEHAQTVRGQGIFADVKEAFWKQEPKLEDVLKEVQSDRVFIVPLFISEGFFTERVIPEALGFKQADSEQWARTMKRDGRTFHFAKPVGTHLRITDVLVSKAKSVVEAFPFPRRAKPEQTSLFIAGHGTPQNADSRKSIEHQVELIRAMEIYAEVQPCFLEEAPLIADVPRLARSKNIVMIPFFISDGLHTVEDIPVLLGEPEKTVRKRIDAGQSTWRNPTEKNHKLIWYASAIGTDPLIAELVLARVREVDQ